MNAQAKKLSVGRGMNRRVTKAGEAAMKRFDDLVVAYLLAIDATPADFGAWIVVTVHGSLRVTPHGNWIAQSFQDWPGMPGHLTGGDARANYEACMKHARALGFDHWKWNFHYDLGAAEPEVDAWKRRLRRVLTYWPKFVGGRVRGFSRKHETVVTFNVESYGASHGFWIVNESDPSDRVDISERAIGRTFRLIEE